MPETTVVPVGLTRRLQRASRLVPLHRRQQWLREWQGEIAWAWQRLQADGASPRLRRRLFTRSSWAHLDALWIRMQEMTMTRALADLRLALRSLRRSPTFALVAVATLALGIGANTAIFSVVNGVLLEPLPYDESDRLVSVLMTAPGAGYPFVPFSDPTYTEFRSRLASLEDLGIYQDESMNLVGDGDPERITASRVTPSVLQILRVQPALGRLFVEADAQPGAEPVALIAHDLWTRRWGADPAILDTQVELDGVMRRIVGVMPPGFAFPGDDFKIWRPYVINLENAQPGAFSSPGIGRLAPGKQLADLEAEMRAAIAVLPELFGDELPQAVIDQIQLAPRVAAMHELIVGDIRRPLLVVLGTVGLVLLVACANVANLFLVRAEARQREVTLRAALGAGTADLVRFYLSESLMLAAAGGIVGLLVAVAAVRGFIAAAPVAIPRVNEIGIDGTVLAFNAAVALLSGLLFGSVPLLRLRARELATALREGGRSVTTGGSTFNTRNVLVVGQVALALVLLVGSGLMLRSFQALRSVDPGFSAESVLTVTLAPPGAEYTTTAATLDLWRRVGEGFAALPGVRAAGAIDMLPLGEGRSAGGIQIEDHPTGDDELPPLAERRVVAPGFFEVMRVPVLAGRSLEQGDGATGLRAVVVSESFAQHWWPNESALGRRVRDNEGEEWSEIVGVVGNVHFESLEKPPEEVIYYPLERGPIETPYAPGRLTFVLSTEVEPDRLLGAARAAVRDIDPRLPVDAPRPMERMLADAMSRTSFTMVLLGIASAVALFLGAVGIYGVISYVVSQRTQEIGVRIALGAPITTVRGMVVRQGMILAGVGIAAGLAGALALSSVMATLLYETSAVDPLTYGVVGALLAATALLATWVPARRASRVDPIVALRAD